MSYLPTVAWQTIVNNVAVVNSTTYTLSIDNINPNDPGASSNTVAVGYYIRDWVGHTYSITGINVGGDPLRIQVVDDFLVGIGPQQGRLAYVYKSVGGGMAPYVAPIRYERLDKSAIGYGLPIDLDVLWENSELKATQNTGICAETPIGIQDISIDYSTRIVTIIPPLGYFHYFTDGNGVVTKHEVIGNVSFPAFTNTTGTWYFYFDNNGNAVSTQQPWTDFSLVATVIRIVWDSTKTPDSAKALTIFAEYHINDISAIDHAWKHRYGSVWFNGLDIFSNFLTTPSTPNADGRNTVIGLSSGTMLDDNLPFSITNTPTPTTFWQQDLGSNTIATLNATNSGIFKPRYKGGAGVGVVENGTRFPFLWDTATNRPQYVNNSGVKTIVTNKSFFVYFVYGIQDGRASHTIRITPAYNEYANITDANAVTWETVQSQDEAARDTEIRPLYKLVFETKTSYSAGCKYTALRVVTDIRKSVITQTTSSIGAILASNVVYTPFAGIMSTNVQSLGLELYNKFQGTLNTLPKYNATGITDSKFTDDGTTPKYNANTIWHAANSNLPTIDWNALNLYVAQKIGVNTTTPKLDLQIKGVNSRPSTSGTVPNGMMLVGGGSQGMYFGMDHLSPYSGWIQSSDRDDLGVYYPISLNPNGGNVGIGLLDPLYTLDVNGSTRLGTLAGYLKGTLGVVGAVSSIPESDISFTDITIGDASINKHGYFPKLPTPTGKYLRDDLTWQTVSGGVSSHNNLVGLQGIGPDYYHLMYEQYMGVSAGSGGYLPRYNVAGWLENSKFTDDGTTPKYNAKTLTRDRHDNNLLNNTNELNIANASLAVDTYVNYRGVVSAGIEKYLFQRGKADNTYADIFAKEFYANGGNYKVWHQGNDGAGSGLDADLIAGYGLNRIMASKRQLLNDENLDNLKEIGSYCNITGNGSGNSNFPTNYGIIDVSGDGGPYGGIQRNYEAGNGDLSYRMNWNGWQPWRKVWDDKNSNLSTVDWAAKDLTVSTAKIGSLSGYLKGTLGVVGAVSSIPESDITPSAYSTLTVTSNATTWDCSTGLNKRVTISANLALTIVHLVDGMSGDLVVNVSSISSITITTTGFTQKKYGSLTSKPIGKYHLCWICEGTNIDFNITDTPYA